VLDIFYAEFIKSVPQYILKREQESPESGLRKSKALTKSKILLKPIQHDPPDDFENLACQATSTTKLTEFESFLSTEFKKIKVKEPDRDDSSSEDANTPRSEKRLSKSPTLKPLVKV
jgi:hypothetical protein